MTQRFGIVPRPTPSLDDLIAEVVMTRFLDRQREALASAMQDEVFGVASQILREEGFAGLTMERIARQAGVSRGTLYNYFADAEAVLTFVEARVVEPLLEAMEAAAGADTAAADRLAAFLTLIFDRVNEDRALALALLSKRELSGPRGARKLETHNRFLGIVQGIVADGVAAGRFRDVDPLVVGKLFLATIGGLVEAMFVTSEFQPSEEIVPHVMDLFLNGICETRTGHD